MDAFYLKDDRKNLFAKTYVEEPYHKYTNTFHYLKIYEFYQWGSFTDYYNNKIMCKKGYRITIVIS